jgi:putative acetyltransferase
MLDVSIRAADPTGPESSRLLEQLDDYLISLYPSESIHRMSPASLRLPHVAFFLATVGRRAVGCGAVVDRNGQYAELKRMFVLPETRGLRIGERLVAAREAHAKGRGLNIVRLETGTAQPAAIRLFERCGYRRRGPYGDYPDDLLSVFMEKHLSDSTT